MGLEHLMNSDEEQPRVINSPGELEEAIESRTAADLKSKAAMPEVSAAVVEVREELEEGLKQVRLSTESVTHAWQEVQEQMSRDEHLSIADALRASAPITMMAPASNPDFADTMYDRLMGVLADFQDSLADDEEVGALVASFGTEVLIHVEDIGYRNPYLLVIYGKLGEKRVELVQHVGLTNLLLIAVKPQPDQEPHRIPIGFSSNSQTKANPDG